VSDDLLVATQAVAAVLPLALLELWCAWTGAGERARTRWLTAAVLGALLAAWALLGSSALARPPAPTLVTMAGLWIPLLGGVVPAIRAAVASLPEAPRQASLRPRVLPFGPVAFVLPVVAWAAIVFAVALAGPPPPLAWVGPAVGLALLVPLRRMLRFGLYEPEPLGGADPSALAARYDAFRRTRIRGLYVLGVGIPLLATASAAAWLLPGAPGLRGWAGGIAGAAVGLAGALFGTWADAQRYLLRREQAGLPPPTRV
jgi:hypothetical protein